MLTNEEHDNQDSLPDLTYSNVIGSRKEITVGSASKIGRQVSNYW